MAETVEIVDRAVAALQESKARGVVKIDLRHIENCFCSFFVVCHGTSAPHGAALAEAVEDGVKEELGEAPFHAEGMNTPRWTVIDYGDVVVHVFDKETRDFYQLEDFWGDGVTETLPDDE